MKEEYLFDISKLPQGPPKSSFPQAEFPIWTTNKARFIARYLKSFTYVTKHGTYIDAFAGPQDKRSRNTSWAAKLVLENEPPWLRNFFLFEKDPRQFKRLDKLRERLSDDKINRSILAFSGDCNKELPKFLLNNPIREREATFCLFDQRSTECDWETVKTVASHKGQSGGHKIEIFYFLAQGWIDRAIRSWKIDVESRCQKWWGNDDVLDFLSYKSFDRGRIMAERFIDEFKYKYSYPFPIQQFGESGRIMFWMIHASDHPRATTLMWQAYRHIGAGGGLNDPIEQPELFR